MMKLTVSTRLSLGAVWLLVGALPAPAGVLYDGANAALPLPENQGWAYGTNPFIGASVVQSAVAGGVRLDSTAVMAEQAGYFSEDPLSHTFTHPGMTPLDRAAGYTVIFDMQINAESHASADRAGFSLIAISSDRMGIELGFWTDTIFAQAADFTHAEEAAFDTTAKTRYELEVVGNGYALRAGGVATPILTGSLRDYTPAVIPPPTPDVYEFPSFLFLGDDTTSAAASVDLAYVELVPEPAALSILAVGALVLLRRRR